MKILKFGGKSLDNKLGITKVLEIITDNYNKGLAPIVVVSARGGSTDTLLALIDKARKGEPFEDVLSLFWEHQI